MTHHIPTIGSITIKRSRRAKNIILTVGHDKSISVTIPTRATIKAAKEFVATKKSWINKQLHAYAQQDKLAENIDFNIDLNKAQDDLFARLKHFATTHNFKYNRVTFRCQKTRWGSCSSDNNISLNINLAFLPPHLQDYILLHELCHIRHKNHSPSFWLELNNLTLTPAKQLNKELNNHRIHLTR